MRLLDTSQSTGHLDVDYGMHPAIVLPLISRCTGNIEQLDIAEAIARDILSRTNITQMIANLARAGLGLIAVERGNKEEVATHYNALTPHQGILLWFAFVSIDRILGILAKTMGNLDDAKVHFEDALAFCRRAGYRPEFAWSLCEYADMLLDGSTGSPQAPSIGSVRTDDDKARAVAMLDESLAISNELGMRPLMERVLSRREILKA